MIMQRVMRSLPIKVAGGIGGESTSRSNIDANARQKKTTASSQLTRCLTKSSSADPSKKLSRSKLRSRGDSNAQSPWRNRQLKAGIEDRGTDWWLGSNVAENQRLNH
jgi:hypothetical protein